MHAFQLEKVVDFITRSATELQEDVRKGNWTISQIRATCIIALCQLYIEELKG